MAQTGRERVLAALGGGTPDRLAVDVGATELTGISAEAYPVLKASLGVEGGHTRIADPFAGTVRVERAFHERLGVDALGLFIEPLKWRSGELPGGAACLFPERWRTEPVGDGGEMFRHPLSDEVFRREAGERAFRYAHAPLAECETPDDVARHAQAVAFFDWPHHADEIAQQFGVRAAARRKETESACVLNVRARLMGGALSLRGKGLLRDLEEAPGIVSAILERLTDACVARLTDVLPEVAPHADVVCVLEGPATGVSVEAYRRHFRRHHERILTHVRKTAGLPVVVMTRGVPAPLLREIAALGPEGIGLGVGAGTPSAAEAREACGPGVAIWGLGCGASVLEDAKPDRVRAEVAKLVEAAGDPAGLIFAFGEPVPPGARPESVTAALEAARALRP